MNISDELCISRVKFAFFVSSSFDSVPQTALGCNIIIYNMTIVIIVLIFVSFAVIKENIFAFERSFCSFRDQSAVAGVGYFDQLIGRIAHTVIHRYFKGFVLGVELNDSRTTFKYRVFEKIFIVIG